MTPSTSYEPRIKSKDSVCHNGGGGGVGRGWGDCCKLETTCPSSTRQPPPHCHPAPGPGPDLKMPTTDSHAKHCRCPLLQAKEKTLSWPASSCQPPECMQPFLRVLMEYGTQQWPECLKSLLTACQTGPFLSALRGFTHPVF